MSSEVTPHGALVRGLLAGLAVALASCGTTSQHMDLSQDMIATPPHRMSRSEYPFDASGRYVDAWAAEGATRYGRFINTDRTEDGRDDTAEPERRPLPPPRETAATTTPPAPEPTPPRGTRPPAPSTTAAKPSSAKPPAAKAGAQKPAAKPPAKKPPTQKAPAKKPPAKKKSTTHTVKRGDSLSSLSSRYGVSVQALKKANNLKSDRIIDGRKLVIPKD